MVEKIAIPTIRGEFCPHFGHCDKFAIFNVENGVITKKEYVDPPAHVPGSHPQFLKSIGCNVVIVGGMGMKAQEILQQNGIKTIIGVEPQPLPKVMEQYLSGVLHSGSNSCSH